MHIQIDKGEEEEEYTQKKTFDEGKSQHTK